MYYTLYTPVSARYEIKKSQFLAFAYPISHKDDVARCVQVLHKKYPDARHICTGYILGDPNNTTSAGFDDDGEPNGTAGRPILNVLQHKNIGNVCVIVVRYFGGIKLGAGGLVRAYATATQMAVDNMTLVPFVAKQTKKVSAQFKDEAQLRYLVEEFSGNILAVDYDSSVILTVQIAQQDWSEFEQRLARLADVL